jgi:BlaI family transcriptional regulator, penicillinase repressor
MKKDLETIILTRQELRIMKVIWDRGEATVRDVRTVMCQVKEIAYTTVLTLMEILEEKGALTHTRMGRTFVYKPLLSRQQATRNHLRDIIARFFNGNAAQLIETVVKNELSPEQLDSLRELLKTRGIFPVAKVFGISDPVANSRSAEPRIAEGLV